MSDVVLVTGATGLLGPYLAEAATALGRVITLARASADICCDLTDRQAAFDAVEAVRPTVVLHAAALTDVDRCEHDEDRAFAMNSDAVAHVVDALDPTAHFLLVSTDQVYPDTAGPHLEPNTSPVNSYGRSKLAGEREALRRVGSVITRVNFFGPSRSPGRSSLSDFAIRSLSRHEPVTFFRDVLFNPLHVETLASLLIEITDRRLTGVLNVGSRDGCTKADFAMLIANWLGLSTETATIGSSTTVSNRAKRPHDLRMDVRRLEHVLGRSMPVVNEEVRKL